jgi:hypothetical protein
MGAQNLDVLAFNGFWLHKHCPNIVEIIKGEEIHGPDGTVTKITAEGTDTLSFSLRGTKYTGKRVGDELVWDDGDVWQAMEAFDGIWSHKTNPNFVEEIRGDEIRGPDGTVTHIFLHGQGRISFQLGGREYVGQRIGDELAWSDGDVWVLQRPPAAIFEGEWQHKMDLRLKEVIIGGTIHGPDGTATNVFAQGTHQLSFALGGRLYTGRLDGDHQLVWDDGDVWVRAAPQQASAELPQLASGDLFPEQPASADLLGHEREDDSQAASLLPTSASDEIELAKVFQQVEADSSKEESPAAAGSEPEGRASELAGVFQLPEELSPPAAENSEQADTVNELSSIFQRAEDAPGADGARDSAAMTPEASGVASPPPSPPPSATEATAEQPLEAEDMDQIFKKQVDGL